MNTDALIKEALEGGMPLRVGHEFFADRTRTNEDTGKFVTALLRNGAYEILAAVMSSGCIDNEEDNVYIPNKKTTGKFSDRYFKMFMELVHDGGVDMELVYPMLFAAFDAPKDGYLYGFVGGIDEYFNRFTYENYDAAADVIRRYDSKLKCLSALMAVDRGRTVEFILDSLIYGKNVNKTAMRKYLLQKRADIVPTVCSLYMGAQVKQKEAIVRLLLLYKGDPRARAFLDEIDRAETSVTIGRLIEKDRRKACKSSHKSGKDDGGLVGSVEKNGVVYRLIPNVDLTVTVEPSPCPKEATAAKKRMEKRLRAVASECETAMENNTRFSASEFEQRLKTDELFAFIASSLLFSVYKNSIMSDVIVVENGEIHDLNNSVRRLDNEEIAVGHPVEWEYYEFLKGLDVKQPFEQIRRSVYLPTDNEKTYNFCARVGGRILPAGDFKVALGKNGFKLLNKNRYDESVGAGKVRGDLMCVIEFAPTDFKNPNKLVAMNKVCFFRYADLIKLGGQIYTEGVVPYPIRSVSPIVFSEFMRDVFSVLGA